ncbi:inhibitor of growth proteins N-terminal histone-binding-domain-containing protein [Pyronema domesticum]|uniref:Chromatin modification-related protein n=1 Tax=Pyronema omphalodes (strain CBS 100304) TaxID=1076935 RepID=U4LP39_PYROM|nr:inhibitor of growth proteins N-terminal histone-binding-domain-containing protein [Pyronema domesticum]CCX31100.1 Similar to Chromatin modification-related protein YNG2; acc. no. Q6C5V7 [Pyronema omphalodes CBS 100304]
MSAPQEDAATVLEIFVNDVANLPLEIQHIYEEMAFKDREISDCRQTISSRDASLQKHIRINGSLTPHPKEDLYVDQIRKAYSKQLKIQDEKIELASKALSLIDKHKTRLDGQIHSLVTEGLMPADALTPAPPPSNLPPESQNVRAGGGMRQTPGLGMGLTAAAGRGYNAGSQGREQAGNKRLKLASGMAVPSLGGGRPGTPGLKMEGSRAGTPSGHSGTRKTGRKKPPAKRVVDDGDDDEDEEEEEDGGEGEDKKLYCVCQQVSYGSMVGCDDKDCPYEWFHWGCVHLNEEPRGKWYCPACTERREKSRR